MFKIFKASKTPILAEQIVAKDIENRITFNKIITATPGRTYTINEVSVRTIQGIHRGPINLYMIKVGELKIFHAGDSGYVKVKDYPSDLAFLPTGNPSPTASPEYALKMALELKPSTVVAIHGSRSQSKEFKMKMMKKTPTTNVIIGEPYVTKKVALKKI
jgi:L-ascorbate metabolism protein UlaG (beta-lactamase superfamily)